MDHEQVVTSETSSHIVTWLAWAASTEPQQYLKHVDLNINSNFYVYDHSVKGSLEKIVVQEAYKISSDEKTVIFQTVAVWSPVLKLSMTKTDLFKRRSDLQGKVFLGATAEVL